MGIEFNKSEMEDSGVVIALYDCVGRSYGHDGITVHNEIKVVLAPDGSEARASIEIADAPGKDIKEALARLAVHCNLMAKAIEDTELTESIPV